MRSYPGCQFAGEWAGWPDGADLLLVEPKLDGYRLSAVVDGDGHLSFHCRDPEPPAWQEHLDHLAEVVHRAGHRRVMLDGEVQARDWNETSKLLRRKRAGMPDDLRARIREEVLFHVFDLVRLDNVVEAPPRGRQRKARRVHDVPLWARRRDLVDSLRPVGGPALRVVPQWEVRGEAELLDLYDELVDLGFEGAIVKDPHAPYVFDDRSAWWKLKPFDTVELEVVGAAEGLGKHAGRLGALVCRARDGAEVRVGTGFTDEQREDFWAHRGDLVGRLAEVSVQRGPVSPARHPAFVRFRSELGPQGQAPC